MKIKRSLFYALIGFTMMMIIFPLGSIPNSAFGDWNPLRVALLMGSFVFGLGLLGGGALISGNLDDEIHFSRNVKQ